LIFNQKILITGGGSIGQRHLRNLITLGVKDIGVVDIKKDKCLKMERLYKVRTYADFETAVEDKKWSAVFVCTPPASHILIAARAVRRNIPVFIEKPLAHDLKGVKKLARAIKARKIAAMVGCNLRFHPALKKIAVMLEKKVLGKVWGVRAEFGQYLPDWHPWEDYRKGYSAQKKMGGGILLDAIHEIDYLYWMFGDIAKVKAMAEKISDLEIDSEDYAEIVLKFKNGAIGAIHLDYLQRAASRSLKIIGEKGTINANLRSGEIKYFLADDKKWRIKKIKHFDYGKTYIDEIKYFLDCMARNKMPEISTIGDAERVLEIALLAKKSSKL